MELLRYGRPVTTVFDLLGRKEDDMTYSLGFVASRSPTFARALVSEVGGAVEGDGVVRLQEVHEVGRTDVELLWEGAFHGIFEAKRTPLLPTRDQLAKYAKKLNGSTAKTKALVAVTNATQAYAERELPTFPGLPVQHVSWRRIRELVRDARPTESNDNKRLLDEFGRYLSEILGMENVRSNMVYVVSLGANGAWGLDFKDVVKRRKYFYPAAGPWPKSPPNYIAFRFDGRLQGIHHVDSYEVFTDPRGAFPDATEKKVPPHFLLTLGPPIQPPKPVKNGDKIKWSARVWAMIDLLLTSSTITEARDKTQKRLNGDVEGLEDDNED